MFIIQFKNLFNKCIAHLIIGEGDYENWEGTLKNWEKHGNNKKIIWVATIIKIKDFQKIGGSTCSHAQNTFRP